MGLHFVGVIFRGRTPCFVLKYAIRYYTRMYAIVKFLAPSMLVSAGKTSPGCLVLTSSSTDLRLNMETNKLQFVVIIKKAHYCCDSAVTGYSISGHMGG